MLRHASVTQARCTRSAVTGGRRRQACRVEDRTAPPSRGRSGRASPPRSSAGRAVAVVDDDPRRRGGQRGAHGVLGGEEAAEPLGDPGLAQQRPGRLVLDHDADGREDGEGVGDDRLDLLVAEQLQSWSDGIHRGSSYPQSGGARRWRQWSRPQRAQRDAAWTGSRPGAVQPHREAHRLARHHHRARGQRDAEGGDRQQGEQRVLAGGVPGAVAGADAGRGARPRTAATVHSRRLSASAAASAAVEPIASSSSASCRAPARRGARLVLEPVARSVHTATPTTLGRGGHPGRARRRRDRPATRRRAA